MADSAPAGERGNFGDRGGFGCVEPRPSTFHTEDGRAAQILLAPNLTILSPPLPLSRLVSSLSLSLSLSTRTAVAVVATVDAAVVATVDAAAAVAVAVAATTRRPGSR